MGAGALINLFLCLDAGFPSTEQYSIKKYQILVKLVTTKHLTQSNWFQVKITLIEPFLDHPTLFSLKRLPSEAFIFYSGVLWSAPDNNFGGYFLEIDP
jgi:hypothetical protein